MSKSNGLSKCLTAFDQDNTLVAVVETSQSRWLVAGIVPGIERQPLKKVEADERALLELLDRWRDEALKAGHKISREDILAHAYAQCRANKGAPGADGQDFHKIRQNNHSHDFTSHTKG